jgi:hypothetical protein
MLQLHIGESWDSGFVGACHRAALCADPLARPGMTVAGNGEGSGVLRRIGF